jgi:hypothetical protein
MPDTLQLLQSQYTWLKVNTDGDISFTHVTLHHM